MIWGTGSGSCGFTLIELMVVLTILAALSMAVPLAADRLQPQRRLELYAQALATDLRDLRRRSLRSGGEGDLVLNDDHRGYRMEPAGTLRQLPGTLRVAMATVTPDQKEDIVVIRFFPDGSSTGGKIIISRDERLVAVDVGALTGRVHVE